MTNAIIDFGAQRAHPARATVTNGLVAIAASVAIIAGLHFGKGLLIPLALSLLFSFLLAPLATRLQRCGLGHAVSVVVTVALASALVAVIAGVVGYQVLQLINSLPQYQQNIEQKIQTVQDAPSGPINRLRAVFKAIEQGGPPINGGAADGEASPSGVDAGPGADVLVPAGVEPGSPATPTMTPMSILGYVAGTTLGPLASAGIVMVLVLFILLEREELRTRLLRLLGSRPGQLYVSTQALDDASTRVSRYLLMQLVVNVTYGIPITAGLYIIGVPSPLLWGMLTVLLRFIPYVGPIIGAAMPVALTLAVDPGWSMFVWTLGLFVVVELLSNNVAEPLLYGTSTGISPVGILLSAVFWAWVWGPVGLLIATPMTACFVVLGRYIPAMSLFPLLLGDQPVLRLHARIYQRLLVMDVDEPDELSRKYLKDHTVEQFYSEVLVPLLIMLEEERRFHSLEQSHHEFMIERVRELVEDTADHADPAKPAASESVVAEPKPLGPHGGAVLTAPQESAAKLPKATEPEAKPAPSPPAINPAPAPAASPMVLNVPAGDDADELVARMLTVLLDRRGIPAATMRGGPSNFLLPGGESEISARVICISALPPVSAVRARRKIARARAQSPAVRVILGLWDAQATEGGSGAAAELKRRLGPTDDLPVVATLPQAVERIVALLGPDA